MTRLRLAVWSPLPPSTSGIADYVAEALPALAEACEVAVVAPDGHAGGLPEGVRVHRPEEAPEVDLDVYHLGNSPAHAYVYRAALARPGVAVLHDWSLHHLVLSETVERGDVSAYLREMRRAHGTRGTFVARQVARALGGDLLPALYPLNDRVLERSLAVVALSATVAERARRAVPGRPVLHLPHHLALPVHPSRAEARQALGIPEDALVVTAPGLATRSKRLDVAARVVARLRHERPSLRLVVAGAVDPRHDLEPVLSADGVTVTGRLALPDFVRHLAAADVVLCLRFPSHGEMSGALVRALGLGTVALVTAGTPPADEFPEGVVVPIDPGPEEEELAAVLRLLLGDASTREMLGAMAREHVRRHHDLPDTVSRLAAFLHEVQGGKDAALARLALDSADPGGLLGYFMEEVRTAAREVGLPGASLGLQPLLEPIAGR